MSSVLLFRSSASSVLVSSWLAAIQVVGVDLASLLDTPSNAIMMNTPTNLAASNARDDDVPGLSQSTLSALKEFYAQRMEAESLLQQYMGGARNVQKVIPEDWVSDNTSSNTCTCSTGGYGSGC